MRYLQLLFPLLNLLFPSLSLPSSADTPSPILSSSSGSLFTLPLKYFTLSSTNRQLWTRECQPHYISYESCLVVLQHSPSCQAAYFVHKVCHLLDLNSSSPSSPSSPSDLFPFDHNPDHINPDEIHGVYITKFPSPSIPLASFPEDHQPSMQAFPQAIDSYRHCVRSNPSGYTPPANLKALPRVNIVISASASWKSKNVDEFSKAISHWKCYAKIHGYNFTLNMIPSKNAADFFVSR